MNIQLCFKGLCITVLPLLFGCVEEFEYKIPNGEKRVCIVGRLSVGNGPFYIRLTEVISKIPRYDNDFSINLFPAIKNAKIFISDDFGNTDTLVPSIEVPGFKYKPDKGYYRIDLGGNDTFFTYDVNYPIYEKGFYKTKNLSVVDNRRYYLVVDVEGKRYEANEFVNSLPKIDSVEFLLKTSPKDGSESYIPKIFFTENGNVNNFYLVQFHDDLFYDLYRQNYIWEFYIIDKRISNKFDQGFIVDLTKNLNSNTKFFYGDSIQIILSSITPDAFNYFSSLLTQFDTDGGAYSSTPSSPPTNIKGGALGYFLATARAEFHGKVE
ncbi:MAG: DUF4249 family protein [Bacteroidales bacterium]